VTGGQPDGEDAAAEGAPADAPVPALSATMIADAIGGVRGLRDTGISALIFVVVNAAAGLTPAIFAALGFGVLLVVFRLARRQPIQQALTGFVLIGIAAFVASRTHSARGFFLPGILMQATFAIAAFASLLLRRPYIGYVIGGLDPRLANWREVPKLLRAMYLASLIWGTVFLLRALVLGLLYLAHRVGWLAAAQLAMGWPLFAAALAASYAIIRRAIPAVEAEVTTGEPAASEQFTR